MQFTIESRRRRIGYRLFRHAAQEQPAADNGNNQRAGYASDRRVVFVLPFEREFTLIGTTDLDFTGEPAGATPTSDEVDYLCRAVNHYFREQISPKQVQVAWVKLAKTRFVVDVQAKLHALLETLSESADTEPGLMP